MASMDNEPKTGKIENINLNEIILNPFQPRNEFCEEKIKELAQSIKTYGLLQPIIVRKSRKSYQLVAGERRLMACRGLGWKTIPAVVKDIGDSAMAAIALIENLQRENLNLVEEAKGYARLMQEFGYTQEALAQRLGKSQSTIANKIRLLKLPEQIKSGLAEGILTERHARALLKLPSKELQIKVYKEIIEKKLTVKQVEQKVDQLAGDHSLHSPKQCSKVVIRDLRIFLNTIHQAVEIIEKSGLNPQVLEQDHPECYEVIIRLPKPMNLNEPGG
ncbi:MAG TPA: nucleoid occlusion protein [Firmicutes bacterium]|nr:nucleoid occlusion protein [Bacillota bacterium]